MTSPHKIAIIGAGIAGLSVANRLKSLDNVQITLFEKARGVSGRTSTRRAEPYHFDHGAPFFTAKSDAFKAFIQPMIEAGVVSDWQARVAEISGQDITDRYQWQADSHFVGVPKMNEMAKYIAKQLADAMGDRLQIKLGSRVGQIHNTEQNQWQLTSDTGAKVGKAPNAPLELGNEGDLGVFDWVVCTAPPEQAVELVPTDLPFYARIANSKTDGCYALMLGFEQELAINVDADSNVAFDVALIKDSPLSCISVNNRKPHRPTAFSLTVLSSNDWAEQHLDADQDWVKAELITATSKLLNIEVNQLQQASHIGMHRWRYANTSRQLDEYNRNKPSFLIDNNQQLAVAGDWLIKGSVENAFMSGDRLGQALLEQLSL